MPSSEDQSTKFDGEAGLSYLRTLINDTKNNFNDDEHAEDWKRTWKSIYDQLRGKTFFLLLAERAEIENVICFN